jgi:hypothetical protein
MPRKVIIPTETVYQEIQSLEESPSSKLVRVVVGNVDADGKFTVPQFFKMYEIRAEMYDDLISANPPWNPTKPEGTYFNEDLWHFIDLLKES